jgi:hypothetical protein
VEQKKGEKRNINSNIQGASLVVDALAVLSGVFASELKWNAIVIISVLVLAASMGVGLLVTGPYGVQINIDDKGRLKLE